MGPTANDRRRKSGDCETLAGRVQSCELRDNTQAGAGWDGSMLLENGEPLFSRHCAERSPRVRFVATRTKKDLLIEPAGPTT